MAGLVDTELDMVAAEDSHQQLVAAEMAAEEADEVPEVGLGVTKMVTKINSQMLLVGIVVKKGIPLNGALRE